jgi:hypothetical protein
MAMLLTHPDRIDGALYHKKGKIEKSTLEEEENVLAQDMAKYDDDGREVFDDNVGRPKKM